MGVCLCAFLTGGARVVDFIHTASATTIDGVKTQNN